MSELIRSMPVLQVVDVAASEAFYLNRLASPLTASGESRRHSVSSNAAR